VIEADDDRRADRFQHDRRQVVQPILRLSQLWQDFSSAVSVAGSATSSTRRRAVRAICSPCRRGRAIELRGVSCATGSTRPTRCATFRWRSRRASDRVVGARFGKSTLTKAIQRLYSRTPARFCSTRRHRPARPGLAAPPDRRRAARERAVQPLDPREHRARRSRRPRALVMQAARLAGAEEFIAQLPQGYTRSSRSAAPTCRRPAPTRRHRPRAGHQSAHPHPRRSDLGARLRERARHSAQHARDRARPHVIIIAHRLAAVRECDRIVGMRAARSSSRTHEQLLDRPDGLYARLWQLQSEPERRLR